MAKAVKTFLVCTVMILLFAATVFFVGWTQFKIKTDSAGVVISKTGGIALRTVTPGEFSWFWEFLLPTNAELKLFSTKPVAFRKRISGELQSASFYKNVVNDALDFSYKFDFSVSAAARADALPQLLKQSVISDQPSLDEYIALSVQNAVSAAVAYFLSEAERGNALHPEAMDTEQLLAIIDAERKYTGVLFTAFAVTEAAAPDYALYKKIRALPLPAMHLVAEKAPTASEASNPQPPLDLEDDGRTEREDASFSHGEIKKRKILLEKND